MKKIISACLFVIVIFSACSKQGDKLLLSGTFTVEAPYKGDLQITFKGRQMILSSPNSIYADTFTYSIAPGKINLTRLPGNETHQYDFEYVDQNSFWIGNMLVTIPELNIKKLLFKR